MFGKNKAWPAAALAGGLVALAALAGCEKEPSVASKSAAAFREAQAKGETFEGAAHGHGHGATTPGGGHEDMTARAETAHPETSQSGHDHAAMGGRAADHSATGHGSAEHQEAGGQDGHAGMDHSRMDHGQGHAAPAGRASQGPGRSGETAGHAGHGATAPEAPATPTPGRQPPSAGHAGHSMPGAVPSGTTAPEPVAPSAGQPARTLSPDPLDAPAPTSVQEAQRSAEMAQGMAGGGHGGHGMGTYRQTDAGRGPGAHEGSEKETPGAEPHQHDPATPPPPGPEEEHSHEPPSAAAHEEAAVYACPMHPEVTSDSPGRCPKCGMTLVKRRKG